MPFKKQNRVLKVGIEIYVKIPFEDEGFFFPSRARYEVISFGEECNFRGKVVLLRPIAYEIHSSGIKLNDIKNYERISYPRIVGVTRNEFNIFFEIIKRDIENIPISLKEKRTEESKFWEQQEKKPRFCL